MIINTMTRLGLGCWHLRDESFLIRAFNAGCHSFDTADIYQNGGSEKKIGKFLLLVPRDQVFIGSKIGRNFYKWNRPWYKCHREVFSDFREEYLEHAFGQSLKRLGTDYLDVLYLHNPSRLQMRKGKIFLDRMKREGKIKYTGVSLHKVKHGFDAIRMGFDVLQVKINNDDAEALQGLVPYADQENVKIVVKEPLARGKYVYQAEQVFNWLADTQVSQVLVGTNNLSHLQQAQSILEKPIERTGRVRRIDDRRDIIVDIMGSTQTFRRMRIPHT